MLVAMAKQAVNIEQFAYKLSGADVARYDGVLHDLLRTLRDDEELARRTIYGDILPETLVSAKAATTASSRKPVFRLQFRRTQSENLY